MCIQNDVSKTNVSRKLAIWDVPSHQLCTLVGACIDVSHIRKLRKRFPTITTCTRVETDYELHAFCVNACRDKNPLSIYLNKYLNRYYQTIVNVLRLQKTDEAVDALWRVTDLTDDRQIAGFCWAILISQYVSDKTKDRIYGEIHMLSHISGQVLRKEQKKLAIEYERLLLEQQKTTRTLLRKNTRCERQRKIIESFEIQVIELNRQSSEKRREADDLLNKQIVSESDSQKNELLKDFEKTIWSQHSRMLKLQEKLKHQEQENEALKANQLNIIKSDNDMTDSSAKINAVNSDLCGKSILYVGGFSRHRDRFKQLIESINGQFLYHDGGMQQSNQLLNVMVQKADAVFCPIDCISHSAVWRIKSLAKTECKDCIFLRSPSLTSFKKEVLQYAS
jgi:hypothetical protein